MAIPENIINEIRERADIVEIIDSYVPLKKAGRSFKALCPFHPEKTPSFYVSPHKQIFHCFGCGEGGNVFHFLMKYLNLSFAEAVKQVAEIVGVEIPQEREYRDSGIQKILDINKIVLEFYRKQLKSERGRRCREYLNSRGLSPDIISEFHLGYALPEWDSLFKFLITKGYNPKILIQAGLILESKESGSYYDLFRDRVIFPILDHKGKILGFGARALGSALPKYINTPETPVYKKGRTLYGINLTLEEIKKQRSAIVVEGYLDMIALYQAGIKNVVASLGTALTSEQVRFLKKYVEEAIIIFDGDQAGQIASLRGLDVILEEGLRAKAVALPPEYDPDSFVREKGKEEFLELINDCQEVFDYKLNTLIKIYGKDNLDARIKIVEEMFSSIDKTPNYLVRSEYIKRLGDKIGFDEKILWEQYNLKTRKKTPEKIAVSETLPVKKYSSVEATLINLMLSQPSIIEELKELVSPQEFITPELQKLVEKIYNIYPDCEKLKPGNLLNILSNEEAKLLAEVLSEDIECEPEVLDNFLTDCVIRLKELRLKKYCEFLMEEIKKAQSACDDNKVDKLLRELNEVVRKGKVNI